MTPQNITQHNTTLHTTTKQKSHRFHAFRFHVQILQRQTRTHTYIYILCSKTNIHRCNMKHIEVSFPPTPPPGVGIGFEPATYRYLSRRPRSCTAEKDASDQIENPQALVTHKFSPVPQSSWKSSEYWPYSGYIPS